MSILGLVLTFEGEIEPLQRVWAKIRAGAINWYLFENPERYEILQVDKILSFQ